MANRYFIASGATANWNDVNSWSETSGGAVGASIPTSADHAIFDANSLSAPCNLTINAEANCLDLDFSGLDNLLTLTNSAYNLNVYGNLTLTSNTYLATAFTGTGYLQLRATTSVNITSNGCTRNWNIIYFNGIGGTWTNQDDWNLEYTTEIYAGAGTWNTNDKTLTFKVLREWSDFLFTLNLSNSVLNLGGISFYTTNQNKIINAGTSSININGYNSNSFYMTRKTLYNLTISAYYQGAPITCSAVENLTINVNSAPLKQYIPLFASDVTVNNQLTINGGTYNSLYRGLLASSVVGTPRTITVNGSIVASNVDFRDITLAGTANRDLSTITGGSGDCGGNSGITFTPSQTQYFKHTLGAVNWSGVTKWFSNYERTIAGRVPLPQDDTIFDENSFTGASTLTVDVPRIGGLNMGGVNKVVTFNRFGSTIYEMYKSVNIPNTNVSFGYGSAQLPMHMYGRGYFTFHCKPETGEIRFYSGTYIVTSDVTATSYFHAWDISTVYLGGNYIKTPYFRVSGASKMYCENAMIEVNAISEYGFLVSSPNFYAENSTIKLTATGAELIAVYTPSIVFNILHLSGLHTGAYSITGNNEFTELIIDSGRKVRFKNNTTQTIGKLTSNGTPANKVTIQSTTAGSQATINYTGVGTPFIENVILKDINFSVPVYALNGTNLGNNTNVKYVWKVAKKTMGFPIRLVKDE